MGPDTLPPDGPYLFYENEELVARWVDTENRTAGKEKLSALADNGPHFATFRAEFVDPQRDFVPDPQVNFTGVKRVIALSDIHGQYNTAFKLFTAHGIMDEAQNWTYGDGHLVIVGDIFDRGDQVTDILWLIHNLQIQAREAGGRVHYLLGNHETMILEGDDRYINKRYRVTSGMLQTFYKDLYGPNTYLGRWLRSLPLSININGNVFIHGGYGRDMAREVSSIERVNDIYRKYLIDTEDMAETVQNSPRLALMHGRQGPLWYRGYFLMEEFDDKDMDYVLRKLDAQRIIVGHTSFTAIKSYFDNRLIAVDSSIKFGSIGEVLIMEGGNYLRGLISGERLPLEPSSTK